MAPAPEPPAGSAWRVNITPETVDQAARNFSVGQRDLIDAYTRLSQQLNAHSAGMAGFDKAAHEFAGMYGPAATAAYQAFGAAINALGGTSLGLTQTINNHLDADHHSQADDPGGSAELYQPHPVRQDFRVAAAPPTITGMMSWAPSTTVPKIRTRLPELPGWVDTLFGTSLDWPQGNPDMFDQTGDAWHAAANTVGEVASWLNWTMSTLLDPTDNDEQAAINAYWATLYKPADSTTVISGLSTTCAALANACHEYADATRKAINTVTVEAIAEIAVILAGGLVARAAVGMLRRLFARLFARAGTAMLAAVARIGSRWAIRQVTTDLGKAIANTKTVKAIKATFNRVAAKSLGRELDDGLTPEQLQEAFNYANKEAKLAHVIDPAKHNFGNLVQSAGGRSEAMRLIVKSLGAGQDLPAAGRFEVTRLIAGERVTIRGAVIDGIPKIGTAFISR